MKVYLVIERMNKDSYNDSVYCVFTDKKKAIQVQDDLLVNFDQNGESAQVTVMELNLNEVTEDYEFYMNN